LNLYHTINKDNDNVVDWVNLKWNLRTTCGFKKRKHLITNCFDKSFKNFKIDDIILSHEDQAISLKGTIKTEQIRI
jgi:hypothetical protein